MSERIIHRGKAVEVTIDNKVCKGTYGQTILELARENDIYIPTMCYLTKVSPITACRMCVVDVEGVEGSILSCQEKAVDGSIITTQNDNLFHQRQNIMKSIVTTTENLQTQIELGVGIFNNFHYNLSFVLPLDFCQTCSHLSRDVDR